MSLTTKHKLLTNFWTSHVNDAETAIGRQQTAKTPTNACDVVFFELPGDMKLHVNVTHARQTMTANGWAGPAATPAGFVHNRLFGRAQASGIVGHVRSMVFASANAAAVLAVSAAIAMAVSACSRDAEAMDLSQIDQQYGVSGASNETISTSDGRVRGTLVPITLPNGRQGQLFIPQQKANYPHPVYVRDEQGLHPVHLRDSATRDEIVRAPAIVETRPEPAHAGKRNWEQEALIIGGSAGAGTAIGAAVGGKKGAGVGAAAGGVGGLIYDLLTREKK